MQDLAGLWSLSDESGDFAAPMTIPGCGVSALQAARVIPDPYFGRNEQDVRWVSERTWVARRSFTHDGSPADLVIEGLDCVVEVVLNGLHLALCANAFRRWRLPTHDRLRAGENTLELHFRSPVTEAAWRQEAQPFFIPFAAQNCPIPHGNMLRKPACDFGWDWNIALGNFGLWGGIALEPPGPRVADILVTQAHYADRIDVALQVLTDGVADGTLVTATLCGATATAPVVKGRAFPTLQVPVSAERWWPAGLGDQTLHTLTVTAGPATATRRIGLRELSLISEPDAAGRSFGFRVNGHDVFARGANWIPGDAMAGRITPEGVRDLLQSAVQANMNMIRVWGGGRYEPDWFYDLCDEMGLMVWQDFMFACNLYPSTPDFLAEIDREVRDVVLRLNHHACLALWCGDNELIGALTWFPESRKDRDRYLVNYDRLNRTIETALLDLMPEANWWPSSPSPGPLSFGDAWHDDSSGDMHFWSVWHEGRDFDHYRDVRPRFCSEFGFQSYPGMNAIRRFAAPADWNIAAPVMEAHQKNAGGNARIAETMFRYFRFPVDFPSFVYLSQVQQGLAIKTAVTQWRSLKPHCMGTLYWQLNDTWPVCSWSSLDHGGEWKLLHHMAKSFFAPVTVVCIPEGGELVLRGINDTREAVPLSLALRAANFDGSSQGLDEVEAILPPDRAVELARLPLSALEPDQILGFAFTSPHGPGCEVFAPRPWKSYDLQPSGLEVAAEARGGVWHLRLTARAMALFAAVEADVPGQFSTNARLVVPTMPVELTFTPRDPGAVPRFTARDLYSATYGQP
jgi:beta-mannosidase